MGVDYRFDLLVGYSVPLKVVEAPYIIEVETKFHYEDRFDPRTGQKLKPAKIIDQRGWKIFSITNRQTYF